MVFDAMPIHDQRHALDVVARLRAGDLTDGDLLAAALLHDAGKGARVRLWHRVVAVLVDAVSPNGMEALVRLTRRRGGTRSTFSTTTRPCRRRWRSTPGADRGWRRSSSGPAWMRGWRLHCGPRTRHPERMVRHRPMTQPIDQSSPGWSVPPEFQLSLAVFEGRCLLLSPRSNGRARHPDRAAGHRGGRLRGVPGDPSGGRRQHGQFVATAAQLILIKSRSLLPPEPSAALPDGADDIDEGELRRRLLAYRAIRNAARTSPTGTS